METTSYSTSISVIRFLLDMPSTVAAWVIGTAVAFFVVAGLLAWTNGRRIFRSPRRRTGRGPRPQPTDGQRSGTWLTRRRQSVVRLAELRRYAEEVQVAAGRAAVTAERRRAEWLAAQQSVESAWQELSTAEEAVGRAEAAMRYGTPRTPHTPAEYAERERHLHRAATAAFWRGELLAQQLCDVLAHRNGWDPRHHPVEQELTLRRAIRDTLRDRHRLAAGREHATWRDAELAKAAAQSLREEAFAAAIRVDQARRGVVPARLRTVPAQSTTARAEPGTTSTLAGAVPAQTWHQPTARLPTAPLAAR